MIAVRGGATPIEQIAEGSEILAPTQDGSIAVSHVADFEQAVALGILYEFAFFVKLSGKPHIADTIYRRGLGDKFRGSFGQNKSARKLLWHIGRQINAGHEHFPLVGNIWHEAVYIDALVYQTLPRHFIAVIGAKAQNKGSAGIGAEHIHEGPKHQRKIAECFDKMRLGA